MNAVDALTLPHGRIADARAWSRAHRCSWIFDRPLIRDTPADIQRRGASTGFSEELHSEPNGPLPTPPMNLSSIAASGFDLANASARSLGPRIRGDTTIDPCSDSSRHGYWTPGSNGHGGNTETRSSGCTASARRREMYVNVPSGEHLTSRAVHQMNGNFTEGSADSRGVFAGTGFGEVRRRAASLRLTCAFVVGLPGFEPGTS